MKKELEQINSRMFISINDLNTISKDTLQDIVSRQLARGLADVIVNEMEILPVTYIKERDPNTGGENHRIRINIISDGELKRLQKALEENEDLKEEIEMLKITAYLEGGGEI